MLATTTVERVGATPTGRWIPCECKYNTYTHNMVHVEALGKLKLGFLGEIYLLSVVHNSLTMNSDKPEYFY